jgi:glycine cleavage system H lipoate-binding protein
VPGGAFLSDGHAWARIEASGQVRVGLDDFARKVLGTIERVDLPAEGATVRRGEPIFTVYRGTTSAHFLAPISGRVSGVNAGLVARPDWLAGSPYDGGWVALLEPADLAGELPILRIGRPVIQWYQAEIARLHDVGGPAAAGSPQVDWRTLDAEFFARRAAA